MSSSDAQRSPVHHATEDSSREPTGPTGPASTTPQPGQAGHDARGGADRAAPGARAAPDDPDRAPVIEGGPGASDGNSGGGAGAGIPGGGTDMRTNGAFDGGNVEEDRKRIFPETAPETSDRNDPDESSFGGPLKLDDPDAKR
jgi:hypothetical protein